MMPYIQGDAKSVPDEYASYRDIINDTYIKKGDVGFLTIDESEVTAGVPHRGARAQFERALHTEAGRHPSSAFQWGGGSTWGGNPDVVLEENVRVLLANSLSDTCALWNAVEVDTTLDGDIGHLADKYPYSSGVLMSAGDVWEMGILTPHESLPVKESGIRQFLRIVSSGVHGREPYFTVNPLLPSLAQ
jgi:hypothetical protein